MIAFELDSGTDVVRLRLNFEVTIEQARALHEALTGALTPARALEVDPAALTRIDAAVLQILLAAARLAPRAIMTTPSPVWTAALLRHGITDPFVQP